MVDIDDRRFAEMINIAFNHLPSLHRDKVKNVAILHADEPTAEQRQQLALRHDQTLLGLYEGVPLSQRQGVDAIFPDRITLFKNPLCAAANTLPELQQEIYHTLWHEIGHYYGSTMMQFMHSNSSYFHSVTWPIDLQ